jgi:hypothetical protein
VEPFPQDGAVAREHDYQVGPALREKFVAVIVQYTPAFGSLHLELVKQLIFGRRVEHQAIALVITSAVGGPRQRFRPLANRYVFHSC